MRLFLMLFAASIYLIVPAAGQGQTLPPAQREPELPYKVATDFFVYPPEWIPGEASGIALNSKGHIFLF
jgi:hypothetical protein